MRQILEGAAFAAGVMLFFGLRVSVAAGAFLMCVAAYSFASNCIRVGREQTP